MPEGWKPERVGQVVIPFLGLLLRLAPLGRYVTPDEPAWVYRAIRFADALVARNWTEVPVTGHPGVTTMWLGALGVAARKLLDPSHSQFHLDYVRRMAWLAPENGEPFRHLAFFLSPGRVAVALVTSLGLYILYQLLARRFERRVALLTVGVLALDPFLIGHSGLLHTDALLATFCVLALAAGLNGLQKPRQAAWWALSGVFTGLALLSKTPALILIPVIALFIAIGHLRTALSPHPPLFIVSSSLFILHCSLFLATTALTLFSLYPALWSDPAEILRTLSAFVARHVEMAQRPVFFAGRMTYDPGWAYYPTVLIFRISPVVLIGLVAGLINLRLLRSERHLHSDHRLVFLLLLAFAVGFGAMMSLGAKKHDRYLLPAIPPLTLASAIAADWAIGRLTDRHTHGHEHQQRPNPRIPSFRTCALLPLAFQALLALVFLLHPLTYFNPLVGGPWTAARVISTDWGEGMGAAARWLNRLPGAARLAVAAPSVPPFAALFEGRTLPLEQASLADYFVLDARHPDHELAREPVHTVTLGLVPHATISRNTAHVEQTAYLGAHAGPDDLILTDAHTPLSRRYAGPGTLISVADLPDLATLSAQLAELSAGRTTLWRVADLAASPITAIQLRQALEDIATPGSAATVGTTTITRYTIRNTSGNGSGTMVPDSTHTNFGNQIVLIGAITPDTPVNTSFPVYLRWLAPAPTPGALTASLQLRDPDRHLWAEVGQLVHNASVFPTSAWVSWEWADNVLTLSPPGRIPPATYTVELVVTDETDAQLGAWAADGQFQGVRLPLGDVTIDPPAEASGQPLCEGGRSIAAGPLLACLPETAPLAIPSGDSLTLALTWSASAAPGSDFQVRWRLFDAAGDIVMEQTRALSRFATANWREGDSFETRYDVRIEPSLPAGEYDLTLNVLAPDGRPFWARDERLIAIEVLDRERLFELPADIAHPLDLTLGSAVHLLGYDLARAQATAGDALPLTLYWQADGPTEVDYTVFVHLVGADGHPHGQVDYFPAGGTAPTTSWASGQVIVDEIALPVAEGAPAGTYHIAVGMYDAVSGGRLPIVGASGEPLPDAQAILGPEITVSGGGQ